MARLAATLHRLDGVRVANLIQRQSLEVTLTLGGRRSATLTFSTEEQAATKVLPVERVLRCYLDGDPIFAGRDISPTLGHDELGGSDAAPEVRITAQNPYFHLDHSYTHGFASQVGVDQSEIIARLVEHADRTAVARGYPRHGIERGSLPATVTRDRTYPDGSIVGELLANLQDVIGGVEVDLRTVDNDDGVLAAIDTHYPRMGTDKSASVRLFHKTGQQNARGFSYTPNSDARMANRVIAVGQPAVDTDSLDTAPAWVSEHLASQAQYGVFEDWLALFDVKNASTLKAHADEAVRQRAYPVRDFRIQPAVEADIEEQPGWERPPRFAPSGDYWLGDTIGVLAKFDGLTFDLAGRVIAATLTEVPGPDVLTTLTCQPRASAAGISGFETTASIVFE